MEMKKTFRIYALARKVLAVAVLKYEVGEETVLFDWAVYLDAVPGRSHDSEYHEVARSGCKQSKEIATLLFPNIDSNKYRR